MKNQTNYNYSENRSILLSFFIIAYFIIVSILSEYFEALLGSFFNQLFDLDITLKLIYHSFIIYILLMFFGFVKNNRMKFSYYYLIFVLIILASSYLGQIGFLSFLGFGFTIWALLIGVIIRYLFDLPDSFMRFSNSNFYIKSGLIVLGTSIIFTRLMDLGLRGLLVSWVVTPIVFLLMILISQKVFNMRSNKKLAVVISAATSVCGVSAAVATGKAIDAKDEDITTAISLTLFFTVIMMILMPILVRILNLDNEIAGAWIGGTIDSSGAVVVAGESIGLVALEVATVIKMLQNLLIGLISLIAALFFSKTSNNKNNKNQNPYFNIFSQIPTFILAFISTSILFSFVIPSGIVQIISSDLSSIRNLLFSFAFLSIGLNIDLRSLFSKIVESNALKLHITGQTLNIILTLIFAIIAFGLI